LHSTSQLHSTQWQNSIAHPHYHSILWQLAPHIAHEGNTESTFGEARGLTNDSIAADFLCLLVRIAGNKKVYKPSWELVLKE
jgi:hypothetical protein